MVNPFFNNDGSLSEKEMKIARETKARGKDKKKRARRSSGSRKSRRFNFFGTEEI